MMAVSTKQLSWDKAKRQFVGELSSVNLERIPPAVSSEHGVRTVGVDLESERTGNRVQFLVREESKDAEGELQFYKLTPTWACRRADPNLADVTMILFND